jgi:WD40 repeat protein
VQSALGTCLAAISFSIGKSTQADYLTSTTMALRLFRGRRSKRLPTFALGSSSKPKSARWSSDSYPRRSQRFGLRGVAITPDGRRAFSASRDHPLRVWDPESGKELALLTADCTTGSCAVSLGGRTIVAGDATGNMHFLRLVESDETEPSLGETKIVLLQHKE